ncbi:hypothetical protein [Hydrogenophaga sp.]|uniref:hypothetical protein n=1 Tax=Hydrogenophaga sp. TaxID=1904254 RepID=UPI0025C660CF|nr:hypothetical protein [Hydrogenophaga sp.]
MTNSSFLGGERAAKPAPGKDIDALGPSDSSDSGSDVQGEFSVRGKGDHADELGSLVVNTANDSDSYGTGERASATGRDVPDGADIMPDHVVGSASEVNPSADQARAQAQLDQLAATPTDPADLPSNES